MRLVFCLFADSVGLLPNHTFRTLLTNDRHSPLSFNRKLPFLFQAMSEERSFFGAENIPFFNGGLFSDNRTIELNHADLGILFSASQHDWSHIEPVIFGTLFERSLDSAKRSMIGAHYTSPEDILLLIEPVVVAPLQRRWEIVKQSVLNALAEEDSSATPLKGDAPSSATASPSSKVGSSDGTRRATLRALQLNRPALILLQNWAAELTRVRILDPACGSGNFLYISLKRLLDLWHEARIFGIAHGLTLALDPIPHPGQLFGIEVDFYAHEIASIVVWIGFLQWKHDHGYNEKDSPLLKVLTNIEHADAILRYDSDGKSYEPTWPEAEYIIGNPPFLGGNQMRFGGKRKRAADGLGNKYVNELRQLYSARVPGGADLVTFWFERALTEIINGRATRAGLLATNPIRMVDSRPVLDRILSKGNIFFAWSDRPWILEGASIRVSMVGFDGGEQTERTLDGLPVEAINADLTARDYFSSAIHLRENEKLCFQGVINDGPFEISAEQARKLLGASLNPNGRPNSDVVKRRLIGRDVVQRNRHGWLIDFVDRSLQEAAYYEWPFEYVKQVVKPKRDKNRRERSKQNWWLHGENRPGLRRAMNCKKRVIVTPSTAKYRIFTWMSTDIVPDQQVRVIARDDDYFFGVLQSLCHICWSLALGSTLEDRSRYTATKSFNTFPSPWPPGTEPSEADSPIVRAIADAARTLVRLRDAWLNPPDTPAEELKKRTLTNLYNQRPTWLSNVHRTLDEAVFAAYGWPSILTTQEILAKLLALNHERAAAQPPKSSSQKTPKPRSSKSKQLDKTHPQNNPPSQT